MECLLKRRTIRNYDPEFVIPKEQLEKIVRAGILAPTACNMQEVDLVVITNKDKIKAISKAAYENFPKETKASFDARRGKYAVKDTVTCDAPCIILLVKNERATQPNYTGVDAGSVMMGLMMAAESEGLNTMALGCIVCPKVEEAAGIPKGSLLLGLALGKVHKKPILDKKEIVAKITFVE